MKIKGIRFKTFVFTTGLITMVVLISFGILYFILPEYYLYTKKTTLNKNADRLAEALKSTVEFEDAKKSIAQFCLNNNSEIISFNMDGTPDNSLSTPFVYMENEYENARYKISVITSEAEYNRDDVFIGDIFVGGQREKVKIVGETAVSAEPYTTADSISVKNIRNNVVLYNAQGDSDFSYYSLSRQINSDILSKIEIIGTLQPVNEAQSVIVSLIPYLLAVDIGISLFASYLFSKRFTKPIVKMSQAAARMQSLIPDISSDIGTDDELGELSRNIDSLYIQLCSNIESLQTEMEKKTELEKSKADFMRAASHELKTPLAALNGITEGMIDSVGVYKDREKFLRESKKLIDKLAVLVNEILNASKLDNLNETIVMEETDISALMDEVMNDYYYQIYEKKLNVSFNKEPLKYVTDKKIIKTTLSNILSNAVKYTPDGGEIIISISDDEGHTVLSVENQCKNISGADMQKMFEPFHVLNYSRDRRKSGTGIGLYIVKRNLEMLQLPYDLSNTGMGLKFSLMFHK